VPAAPPRKQSWTGLFDPRITGPSPSIYLFLKNHRSGFKIAPELREGTPVGIPRISIDSIQFALREFGILITDKQPHYTSEYPVLESVQEEFTRIKQRIMGDILHVVCNKDLISKHDYIITNGPELIEFGMMRPRYIQLKFHTVEDRNAVLAILSPK
jgi:hypothetical protein